MIKVGCKVKLDESLIKWYLNDSHECFVGPGGAMNKRQKKRYDNMITTMMALGIKNDILATVTEHHYPNSEVENYRVEVLGYSFNIDKKHLRPDYAMNPYIKQISQKTGRFISIHIGINSFVGFGHNPMDLFIARRQI